MDEDKRKGITRDLGYNRSYAVAVRAVTTDPAQASPWLMSADAHPALVPEFDLNSISRRAGSISLSWMQPIHAQGYEIECAKRENNVTGAYTRCADVETSNVALFGTISVTISSWSAGGTDYTIDDAKTYDLKVRTTNAWGSSAYQFAPLIHPHMVSNLASAKTGPNGIHNTLTQAVAFTTGSNSGDYVLKSITLPLKRANSRATNLTLALREMEGSGQYSSASRPSDTVLATLTLLGTSPNNAVVWTDVTFTCSGSGCDLDKNSTYFVVATSSDGPTAYEWAYTTSQSVTLQPDENGWSIGFDHYRRSTPTWQAYTTSKKIAEIVFATNPSLTASSIGMTTATLTTGGYSGSWYYKHTNTGATCDGPVAAGTSTKALTSLTAGTSYTYSAYSDSTCTTGNLIATAAQFTTQVSVSNLSETSDGRLFVGGAAATNNAWATSFSVPSGSTNYILNSITAKFGAKTSGAPGDIAAKIYSDSSGKPGTEVANLTLTGPTSPVNTDAVYTCSGTGCELSAGSTYHLAFSAPSNHSAYGWQRTGSNNQTNAPATGSWAIGDYSSRSTDRGSSWTALTSAGKSGLFKVVATAKP